jgi:hypothetical protein
MKMKSGLVMRLRRQSRIALDVRLPFTVMRDAIRCGAHSVIPLLTGIMEKKLLMKGSIILIIQIIIVIIQLNIRHS